MTRLAWSEEDRTARALLAAWVGEAGVATAIDAAGNLIAELPGSEPGLAPLATGSHTDTVVDGGPLDGAYGAVAGFEVVAALAASGRRLRHPLRVVAWANEEGVVAPPFTGSMAAAGYPVDVGTAGAAIEASGGSPAGLAGAAWGGLAGYLELHIEQGPVLEHAGVPIGVVTGIAACRRGVVTFEGAASHAGTTPMHLRRDALVAAAHTVLAVEQLARAADGPVDVATAGALSVLPGNANVVPGQASVTYDLRSLDDRACDTALATLRAEVEGIAARTATSAAFSPTTSTAAVRTDDRFRAAVADAATGLGLPSLELASGAGHDAQQLAAIGPVGMIFVPSVGGVSHNPAEATAPEHLVAGANVLLHALRLLDERLDPSGGRRQ